MLFANNFVGRENLVLIAAVCILLAACSSQVEVPLPTATFTTNPTTIPSQTPTLSPTATPLLPDLPFSGFYFKRDDPDHLYILNNSLRNWETIEFPEGSHLDWLGKSLSPDKNWVVFETGSIDEGDIAINLMFLPDRSVITIAALLSDRYPDDLLEIVHRVIYEDLSDPHPELNPWNKPARVLVTFKDYLGRSTWSPNGRYLAFIGQMDGPSSDLYVYNLETDVVARITADENIVRSFEWSPDGDTIVFDHIIPGGNIDLNTLHVADVTDRDLNNPIEYRDGPWWYKLGWLSNTEFITSQTNDGAPNIKLDLLDIGTGQMKNIWPYYFYELAINPDNQDFLLGGFLDFSDAYFGEGGAGAALYYLDEHGEWDLVFEEYSVPYYWNGLNSDFLVKTGEAVYTYSPDNGLVKMAELGFNASMVISPDSRWVVFTDFVSAQVYGPDDKMVLDIPSKIGNILWGPNSAGFFYLDDDWLHYVSLPDGEITVLEPCPQRACWIYKGEIVWLED